MLMRVFAFATVPAPIEKGSLPTHVQGGPGWCCVIRAQVCGLLRNVIRKPRRGQRRREGGGVWLWKENPPRRSEPNNNPETQRHPPTPTPSSVPHACIVFVFCLTPPPSAPPSPCLSSLHSV